MAAKKDKSKTIKQTKKVQSPPFLTKTKANVHFLDKNVMVLAKSHNDFLKMINFTI